MQRPLASSLVNPPNPSPTQSHLSHENDRRSCNRIRPRVFDRASYHARAPPRALPLLLPTLKHQGTILFLARSQSRDRLCPVISGRIAHRSHHRAHLLGQPCQQGLPNTLCISSHPETRYHPTAPGYEDYRLGRYHNTGVPDRVSVQILLQSPSPTDRPPRS